MREHVKAGTLGHDVYHGERIVPFLLLFFKLHMTCIFFPLQYYRLRQPGAAFAPFFLVFSVLCLGGYYLFVHVRDIDVHTTTDHGVQYRTGPHPIGILLCWENKTKGAGVV